MSSKQLVLIVGASGNHGRVVVKDLLEDGNFRVAMLVRAKSVDTPITQELKAAGAEVRVGDLTDTQAELEVALKGVDVLISFLLSMTPGGHDNMFNAAKAVGVGRVIPSDFGPSAPRGVMDMHDLKLDIRESIKAIGLPYTFIESGWWLRNMLPPLHAWKETVVGPKSYVGNRKQKVMYTSIPTTSHFLVKIIADERTLNRTVVVPDGEVTLEEVWKVAENVTGEDFSDYPQLSEETLQSEMINSGQMLNKVVGQYFLSIFIRGDNTVEAALANGALDARTLFPDVPVMDLEQATKEFYATTPADKL